MKKGCVRGRDGIQQSLPILRYATRAGFPGIWPETIKSVYKPHQMLTTQKSRVWFSIVWRSVLTKKKRRNARKDYWIQRRITAYLKKAKWINNSEPLVLSKKELYRIITQYKLCVDQGTKDKTLEYFDTFVEKKIPIRINKNKTLSPKTKTKPREEWLKSKEFLSSPQWREVRYKVLLKYGKKCQCCGGEPPKVIIHVDHIKPRSKYPELALDQNNLQVLCEDCNLGKMAWDETDHRN